MKNSLDPIDSMRLRCEALEAERERLRELLSQACDRDIADHLKVWLAKVVIELSNRGGFTNTP